MEIRRATSSRAPIAARGTGLPTTAWYAATGDLRPRPARLSRDLSGVVGGSCTNGPVARAAVEAAGLEAVASDAAVAHQHVVHLPFLPLQETHPRGAPV